MGSVLLDFVIVFNMRRVYSKNMNEDDPLNLSIQLTLNFSLFRLSPT